MLSCDPRTCASIISDSHTILVFIIWIDEETPPPPLSLYMKLFSLIIFCKTLNLPLEGKKKEK